MDIAEKVISVIKKNLQRNVEVHLESRLVEDLFVDSFDKLMLISALEDEFSINVEEEDFLEISTVNDIVEKFKIKYL